MDSLEKYTKPKESRYNEASLIKKMESLSLGRPSTYASMIKKIQETQREYVQKKTIPSQKVDITRITFTYPNIINTETKQTLLPSDKNNLQLVSTTSDIIQLLNCGSLVNGTNVSEYSP